MIDVFSSKKDCCGCTACFNICPTKAITMATDDEGFKYPLIDQDKCIDCGLCKKTCDFQRSDRSVSASPEIYAIKHKNDAVRDKSTSGGAFSAISDYVLGNSGIIYGVKFNKNMVAVHARATTDTEKAEFRGSKYVQSDLNDIFLQVCADLDGGKPVLFSGTPCQCAGLRSFLDKKKCRQANLIICDIVCHGVPSPKVFKDHINAIEQEKNKKISNYFFRAKVNGWHTHTEGCRFEDGTQDFSSRRLSVHKAIFYSGNSLRPACYSCRYTSFNRPSDITIADFWGIEKTIPEFDDNKGVSLLLINSDKGKKVFEEIKESLDYRVSDAQACLQPNLQHPTAEPKSREGFWRKYQKRGFKYISDTIIGTGLRFKIRRRLKGLLAKFGIYDLV